VCLKKIRIFLLKSPSKHQTCQITKSDYPNCRLRIESLQTWMKNATNSRQNRNQLIMLVQPSPEHPEKAPFKIFSIILTNLPLMSSSPTKYPAKLNSSRLENKSLFREKKVLDRLHLRRSLRRMKIWKIKKS